MAKGQNLNELKENDLKKYSLNQTLDVIKELENIALSYSTISESNTTYSVEALEDLEKYYSFVTIINNRIQSGDFDQDAPKNWKNNKSKVRATLLHLFMIFQQQRDFNRINLKIKNAERITHRLHNEFKEVQFSFYKKIEKHDQEYIERIEEYEEQIKETEGKTISHVLSIMGVFSAVITVILSVVVTSSSWLNNANGSSAIMAFTIPNLVALIAVVTVILLIVIYNAVFFPPTRKKKGQFAILIIFCISLLSVIILGMVSITKLAYKYAEIDNEPHLREIINADEYKVVSETSKDKFFEFEYDGKNYQFAYDEKYIHDSQLYFCPTHDTLE